MKKKLSLHDLKVSSFVTDIEKKDIIGGAETKICVETMAATQCLSQINFSQCQTCGIACTSPQNCYDVK